MSGFLRKLQRYALEMRHEPAARIPAKLARSMLARARAPAEEVLHRTGAGRLLARRYRGVGVVLMFHEIHDDVDGQLRTGCGLAQLRQWVEEIRSAGRDIVTPDEALRRLADPGARSFAVLTFDDAYRDVARRALPLLEQLEAPFTLFVPTGMVTGDLNAWWLGLRDLFKRHDTVDIAGMGRTLPCHDLWNKIVAFRVATDWIGTEPERARALDDTFKHYRINLPALVAEYGMDRQELKMVAAHPLVTIGGHTTSHPWLARLDEAAALADIVANKAFLENLLDRQIRFLAYPYGTPGACGVREAKLAASAGYRSAFTTRPGHLFADHLAHRQLMPRENGGIAHLGRAAMASRLTGVHRAVESRFGNPVATTA